MHIHSAIDIKTDASEIVAAFAAEEGDGQADITHFAKAERNGGGQFGDAFLAMCLVKQFCFDNAWATAFTVMPYGAAVRANVFVKLRMPPFVEA